MSSPSGFSGSVADTYHALLGPMLFEPYARDIGERLKMREGERILEIASGTGVVTEEILRRMPAKGTLVASDHSEGMLNVGRARIEADPLLTLQLADACAVRFA